MGRNVWLRAAVLTTVAVAVLGATTVATASRAGTQTSTPPHHSTIVRLAGTWSGKYSGAFSGTFTLHWTQVASRFGGSITLSNPKGKYAISGSVRGSAISFGAVAVGATYTGKVSGKTMSGGYKSPQGGGTWSATKTS